MGARREMGCAAGKTAATEQRAHAQPHEMGEHGSRRYFERNGKTRKQGPVVLQYPESGVALAIIYSPQIRHKTHKS